MPDGLQKEYLDKLIETHGWVGEIRGDIKAIKGNCLWHKEKLEDHETRIRTIEKDQENIFKMILRPILAIFGRKI
jgi:hypothetical protein